MPRPPRGNEERGWAPERGRAGGRAVRCAFISPHPPREINYTRSPSPGRSSPDGSCRPSPPPGEHSHAARRVPVPGRAGPGRAAALPGPRSRSRRPGGANVPGTRREPAWRPGPPGAGRRVPPGPAAEGGSAVARLSGRPEPLRSAAEGAPGRAVPRRASRRDPWPRRFAFRSSLARPPRRRALP